MERTTILLPKALAKWAKEFAKGNGQTFSGLLRVTLEEKKKSASKK
jgi:hypothetical protein